MHGQSPRQILVQTRRRAKPGENVCNYFSLLHTIKQTLFSIISRTNGPPLSILILHTPVLGLSRQE